MKKLKDNFTALALSIILLLFMSFHVIVIAQIIPFSLVWGGIVKDHAQMLALETVSILILLIMLSIVGIKVALLKIDINSKIIKNLLFIMALFFFSNTIGNSLSAHWIEKLIFTPLTGILSLFSLLTALNKGMKPFV